MNIGMLATHAAEHYPERTAFFWGDEVIKYGEFGGRVAALAAAFRSMGIREGDRIALYTDNCPQLLESYFAAWQAGACVVPLNARFVPDEVVYHVENPRARALVFAEAYKDTVRDMSGLLSPVEHYVCFGEPAQGQLAYEELVAQNLGAPPNPASVADADPAWLFYTSGTTGRPKGAILTHGNLSFVTVGWCADLMCIEPEDVGLHAAPLSHGAGFHALALTAKCAAQVIAESPRFDPQDFCALVERHGVTNSALVPTQVKRLISFEGLNDYDLSTLRYLAYYGSPMYVEDLKDALEKMGRIFVQLYGQGETPMTATYLRREEHVAEGPKEHTEKLASCGRARTCVDVAILDEENREVQRGQMGEICVRGPSVFAGYWEKPEETVQTLRNGWLHTGDLGRMDERGYVYVMDRTKDMIISGGSNVYPREVEEVLLEHPDVSEAAVIGVPDPEWGESVKAVLVLASDSEVSAEEIIAYCRERMAPYKRPKSVSFVNELPKSAIDKVLKRELREMFVRQSGADAND